jgi:hypothetical protein
MIKVDIHQEPNPPSFAVDRLFSQFKQLCTKIWQAVCEFFAQFSRCLTPHFTFFSPHQITLLRDQRLPPRLPLAPGPQAMQPLSQREFQPIALNAPNQPAQKAAVSPYKSFDPQLEEFRAFFRDFSTLLADSLHEKYLASGVESVQQSAPAFPALIKWAASLLVEVGDKASKPLFRSFAQQKAQVIDPALKMIFNTLLKDHLQIRSSVSRHLEEYLKTVTLPTGHTPQEYIDPVLSLVSASEGQKSGTAPLLPPDSKLAPSILMLLTQQAQKCWEQQQTIERKSLLSVMKQKLQQELKNPQLPKGQLLDQHYIDPILNWLLLSDHTTPIQDLFMPAENFRQDLIDKIMEQSVTLLVERQIDFYTSQLQVILQDKLNIIVRETLQKNAVRLSDFLTERFADLVTHMPFTHTFDAIVNDVIAAQVRGYIEAQADPELNEQKTLLKEAKKKQLLTPLSLDEEKDIQMAKTHLEAVNAFGGEQVYLEQQFMEAFAKQPACTMQIQQLVQQQRVLRERKQGLGELKKASENALCNGIAEKFLTLMLSTKKRVAENGSIEEVQPLTELWNSLYLPPEFHQLQAHFEDLASEFITPAAVSMFSQVKKPLLEGLKISFNATLQEILKIQLMKLVQTALEKITVPEQLDKLMAENMIPAMNRQLIKRFMHQELEQNIAKAAPLFQKLLASSQKARTDLAETAGAAHQDALADLLINTIKEKFRSFKPEQFKAVEKQHSDSGAVALEYEPLAEKECKALALAVIERFKRIISQAQINGMPVDPATLTEKDIADILKESLNWSSGENDPVYWQLTSDLLFRLGGLSGETVISYCKGLVGNTLTDAVSEMRESHHFLLETITSSLKETLLNKQYLQQLLSDTPCPHSQLTEQKLAHQIHITAALSHDLLMRKAECYGTPYKFAAKLIFTDNPDKLEQVMMRLYKQLLGKELLNQNLAVATIEEIFGSLAVAAMTIAHRESVLAHQTNLNASRTVGQVA